MIFIACIVLILKPLLYHVYIDVISSNDIHCLQPLLHDVYIDVSSSNDIHCLHCVWQWSSALCYLEGRKWQVDVTLLIESRPNQEP